MDLPTFDMRSFAGREIVPSPASSTCDAVDRTATTIIGNEGLSRWEGDGGAKGESIKVVKTIAKHICREPNV